jgi:hypothetical protein
MSLHDAFAPYFGPVPPLLALAGVAGLGTVALTYLRARAGFCVVRRVPPRERLLPPAVAALLVLPVVAVDLLGGFPRELNVPLPTALVFYPLIGAVAETVFHAVPLALLMAVLRRPLRGLGAERTVWICIVLASSIEPTFQVMMARGSSPVWATTYVGLHLAVFNLLALSLFRRVDFLAAYLFRLAYYLIWHIVWGVVRLDLLF